MVKRAINSTTIFLKPEATETRTTITTATPITITITTTTTDLLENPLDVFDRQMDFSDVQWTPYYSPNPDLDFWELFEIEFLIFDDFD